jgi:hypothetical protein
LTWLQNRVNKNHYSKGGISMRMSCMGSIIISIILSILLTIILNLMFW